MKEKFLCSSTALSEQKSRVSLKLTGICREFAGERYIIKTIKCFPENKSHAGWPAYKKEARREIQ